MASTTFKDVVAAFSGFPASDLIKSRSSAARVANVTLGRAGRPGLVFVSKAKLLTIHLLASSRLSSLWRAAACCVLLTFVRRRSSDLGILAKPHQVPRVGL
jgi:hypothetical protein